MRFTGKENHEITLEEAARLTANYRETLNSPTEAIAEYFGMEALNAMLSQDGCVGIRIYYGLDSTGEKKLVLVGVNAEGNDLYEGQLMERGETCPSCCSEANPLNSEGNA